MKINGINTTTFKNFDGRASGRVLTHCGGWVFVACRNPYGSHNLIVVDEASGTAYRHGNTAALWIAANWCDERTYRKVAHHCRKSGMVWTCEAA